MPRPHLFRRYVRDVTRLAEHAVQQLDVFGESAVGAGQFFHLLYRVHDRRMVAPTEPAADLGQRTLRQMLGQLHRHLARPGDDA